MHFKQRPGRAVCQSMGTGVIRANGAALWGPRPRTCCGRFPAHGGWVWGGGGIDKYETSAHGSERKPPLTELIVDKLLLKPWHCFCHLFALMSPLRIINQYCQALVMFIAVRALLFHATVMRK